MLGTIDECGPDSGNRCPPGRIRDIAAARRDHILAHRRTVSLEALADLGFLVLDKTSNPW
ncbi:hypothetical protein [Streptomyces sp. SID2888]|uniref:hypothetical protein n=1 Tax=Streptomyces sp. SID2888 TaxID=2690256 RepID=UPI00136C690E|nr:hypothetical protein [Streptomyces sp. SID2888]MYV48182.1 hypothetical protein [Streptomyces sp. SID2888]